MKALSFLGRGNYQTVTYVFGEHSCTTSLFPEALARMFPLERLFLFVTEEARRGQRFLELRERLGDLLEDVTIPEGKSEEELWEIFARCAACLKEGDIVVLDITHAFRSLPLIVFTVSAYLRKVMKVEVQHILYGAYEARVPRREPPQPEDCVPVFDLAVLLDLLDWLSGVEAFLARSEAGILAEKLRITHDRLNRSGMMNGEKPRRIKRVAGKLEELSKALHLSRPLDVMEIASLLLPELEEARAELSRWARPFAVVLEKVAQEVGRLAEEHPRSLSEESLGRQLELIEHYLEKGLVVQAVLLAREWVVSWACLKDDQDFWLNRKYREGVESILGGMTQQARDRKALSGQKSWMTDALAREWGWLTQLRNDIAHCGMSVSAKGAQSIESKAKAIPGKLRAILASAPGVSPSQEPKVVDLETLYDEVAKLELLPQYLEKAKELAGEGCDVVLTGQAPVWLYLAVAHALHGKARRLYYSSPVTGKVLIFDHAAL
jgi:CRISPR-associated DxTHG motif protein